MAIEPSRGRGRHTRLGRFSLGAACLAAAALGLQFLAPFLMLRVNWQPGTPPPISFMLLALVPLVIPSAAVAAIVSGHISHRENPSDAALAGLIIGYLVLAVFMGFIVLAMITVFLAERGRLPFHQ